jgi:hypothetical protein
MRQFVTGFAVALLVVAVGFGAYAYLNRKTAAPEAGEVRRLVVEKYGDCGPDQCRELTVKTEQAGNGWVAVATYNGLYDDSVAASRLRIPLVRENDGWKLGESVERSWRCGRMDSSPEFITELCP